MGRVEPVPRALGLLVVLIVVAIGTGFVLGGNRSMWEARTIERIVGARASSTLTVTVRHNLCSSGGPQVRVVSEADDRVVLRAEQDAGGDCEDIGIRSDVVVDLELPLDERRVEVSAPSQPRRASVVCVIDSRASDRCP